jgi:hypothetical protein
MREKMSVRWANRHSAVVMVALAGLGLLGLPVCTGFAQTRVPELSEIIPTAGPAGTAYPLRVTIRGTGFLPAGNEINFGPLKIPDVPSEDGSQLSFQLPKQMPSVGEVPPMVLPPGEYQVTVKTMVGISNALPFTLTGGG